MRLSRRALIAVLALPVAVELIYLLLPILSTFQMSLYGFGRLSGIHRVASLANYREVFTDPYYTRVWVNTVRVSAETAAITVVVSAFVAYVLWTVGGRYRAYLTVVILAPLLVSGIVRAYGWIAILGPTGSVDTFWSALGFGHPQLLYHEPAVILGFVHVFLPFGVLMILAQLDTVPPAVIRAAANLGAGSLQIAGRVLLPLVYPVLLSAFLLVFALAMASYAIPAILGGGRVLTIAQVIFSELNGSLDWPRAAAMGLALTLITIVVMLVYQLLAARLGRRPAVVEV